MPSNQVQEYAVEDQEVVDVFGLRAERLPEEIYKEAHAGLVIPCHDIIVEYEGKALMVKRNLRPAKGIHWPLGGRLQRGVQEADSLAELVKRESNLDLDMDSLEFFDVARTMWRTDPFGHGKGTDTRNTRYFGRATGTLELDDDHLDPLLLDREGYEEIRDSLHPYARDMMDMSLEYIE